MAASPDHGKLDEGLQGIHRAYQWAYANAAARTGASGFVATDVGKFARQTDDNSIWLLTAVTPTWVQVGGAGAGAHDLLDGSANQDTTASAVTRGDLIVGNSTPKWDDLAIGTARQFLAVNGGGTDPEWASFDWDNAGAAAGADMVHDHSAAGEGSKLAQANTHETPDTDAATSSLHHTIGGSATQAAAGNHTHGAGSGDFLVMQVFS